MRKITVFIKGREKDIYLDDVLITNSKSKLTIKNATVYWNYKNIYAGVNDTIILGAGLGSVKFGEGYWTFNMIKDNLKKYGILVTRIKHNNTCDVKPNASGLNLGKFGTLLGFPENHIITTASAVSPNRVDINNGLRYITINCDIVNTTLNSDTNGKRSSTMITLPITTSQNLNASATCFENIESKTTIINGYNNKLLFSVSTNIGNADVGSILLEMLINE